MKRIIIIISCFQLLSLGLIGQDDVLFLSQNNTKSIMPVSGHSNMKLEDRLNLFFELVPEEMLQPRLVEKDLDVSIFRNHVYNQKFNKESFLVNEIQAINQDYGLSVSGYARYNFSQASNDEAMDELTRYSFVSGLQWDALKNGYRDARIKKKQLTNQFEIQRLEQKKNEDNIQYVYRQRQLNTLFNQLLLKELKYHRNVYKQQINLYLELYYLNLTPYTSVIDVKKAKEQIDIQISQLEQYNENFDKQLFKQADDLPIFDLDLEELIKAYNGNTLSDSIATKRKELLNNTYKLRDEKSLSILAQYRTFQTQGGNLKSSPVVNVTFKMPISREAVFVKRAEKYEGQIIDENLELEKEADIQQIIDLYTDYQTKLKDVKGMYYQLYWEKEKLQSARISKQQADKESIIGTFIRLNNILALRRQMIFEQRELYLKALQIFSVAGTANLVAQSPIIKKIEWKSVRPNELIIVMDTNKDLSDIQFMVNYLKRKNFNKIYLKGSGNHHQLTLELLKYEGFEVLVGVKDSIKIHDINEFETIQLFKEFLSKNRNHIAINDIHTLLQLEMSTVK